MYFLSIQNTRKHNKFLTVEDRKSKGLKNVLVTCKTTQKISYTASAYFLSRVFSYLVVDGTGMPQ